MLLWDVMGDNDCFLLEISYGIKVLKSVGYFKNVLCEKSAKLLRRQ